MNKSLFSQLSPEGLRPGDVLPNINAQVIAEQLLAIKSAVSLVYSARQVLDPNQPYSPTVRAAYNSDQKQHPYVEGGTYYGQ